MDSDAEVIMTLYEKLYDMKFRQGVPTCELVHRFPKHRFRIHEVALLEVPQRTLKEVVREKALYKR